MDVSAVTGTGGPAPEPTLALQNPELEKITLVQNCEWMMKIKSKLYYSLKEELFGDFYLTGRLN